jgi:transcriptional regulator GlxA family with amidase domain
MRHVAEIYRTLAFLPLADVPSPRHDPVMHIQILLYDGFDELDAVGPYEILAGAGFDTQLATLEPVERITASHGAVFVPHATLAERPDLLIVPGGGWRDRKPVGTHAEYERGVVPAAIAERHAAGSTVASVCTGAMLLAKAGILDGRPATTHWAALDDLRAYDVDVHPEARVVDDGDVLTCGGVTSGLDLALHIVEQRLGADAATFAARLLEHERRQEVFARSPSR